MEEKNIYDWTGFEQGLEELGISLNETQRQQFQDYYELLTEWNSFPFRNWTYVFWIL